MGSPLDMALSKVMGLSDEAIKRRLKKSPTGADPVDDMRMSSAGEDTQPNVDQRAREAVEDTETGDEKVTPDESGLSDADKKKLRELYARLTKGE